jgi:beta-glucanase (GH16 family)
VENGHLVIEARRENVGGQPFTSGRIKTSGRVAFRYGTLEARIKVPQVGNGLWPAFWMLGSTGGTWPHNGEVDMLEMGFAGAIAAGKANQTASAATHWWTENPGGYTGYASYARDTVTQTAALSDDYHLYKLTWDKSFITISLDDSPYYKIAIDGGNGLDAFQQPFYILLNLAVGGNHPFRCGCYGSFTGRHAGGLYPPVSGYHPGG